MLRPDTLVEPYDRNLKEQSPAYRAAWGFWVTARVADSVGPLSGVEVEMHAGEAYVDALREPLEGQGALVLTPLARKTQGEQLAWYGRSSASTAPSTRVPARPADPAQVDDLVQQLSDPSSAMTTTELRRVHRSTLDVPGVYSWWVDLEGAADLSVGLQAHVFPGLLYAGQAGATHWPSGGQSENTLWLRFVKMHLGDRAKMSTLRRSLAAALRGPLELTSDDDPRLSEWIDAHLRVVVVVRHADELGFMEPAVLKRLDPPLNLLGMPETPLRRRLSALRQQRRSTP